MKIFFLPVVLTAALMLCVGRSAAQTTVKINEVFTRGVAGNLDWVEIYNAASTPIDISGFKIYDAGGRTGAKPKKLFPAGTTIQAKGFTVVITDTASYAGDLSAFGLGNGGDSVWVENAGGALIDSVYIPALGKDSSYSRVPDGSQTWKKTLTTRGASNGSASSVQQMGTAAETYHLGQNYPNPYNPSTTITFAVPAAQMVTVKVFDLLGKVKATLVNEVRAAGTHAVQFDAGGLTSGVYFYQLRAGTYSEIKKMTVVK